MRANPATVMGWITPCVYGVASLGSRETGRIPNGAHLAVLVKALRSVIAHLGRALTLMTWLPRYKTTAKSYSPEFGYVATPIVSIPATSFR